MLLFAAVQAWAGSQSGVDSDGDGLTDQFERTHYLCLQGWGMNFNRQATNALGLAHITDISAGFRHNLVLTPEGKVFAWGQHNDPPPGLGRMKAIAAGYYFSAALRQDGTVVVWGLHADKFEYLQPPPGLTNIAAIAAGGRHVLAIDLSGNVHAWGSNKYSEIDVPSGLSNVVAVAAGGEFSLALDRQGKVTAWGNNYIGALNVPEDLSGVRSITAGRYYAGALLEDGSIRIWGRNPDGKWYADIQPPAELSDVTQLVAAPYHCVALTREGKVYAWGSKSKFQCCDLPDALNRVVKIAAGGSHTLVATALLDPSNPDSDADGLLDGEEVHIHQTSPWLADTDGDGWNDGVEVAQSSDPLEPASTVAPPGVGADPSSPMSAGVADGAMVRAFGYRGDTGELTVSLFGERGFRYRIYGTSSLRDLGANPCLVVADFEGTGAEVDIAIEPWCDTCFFFYSKEESP